MKTCQPETLPEAEAVMWATLGAIAKKEGQRERLTASAQYPVDLYIRAKMGAETLIKDVESSLSVGADSVRASSSAPNTEHLLGLVLSKLNAATREKILRELPEMFAKAGNKLPEVDELLVDLAKSLLQRLRAKQTKTIKGSVSCHYQIGAA